jgi:cytochrome c biogenesis protein CcmG/thiol:disulfide interchange protein DsbE
VTVWGWDRVALAGEGLDLDALKGKTVVLNFWASWCIPCQQEAPMFERIWNEYKDRNVVFLGVNTEDTDSAAYDYVVEYGLTYPHAPDQGGRMEKDYRITGIPETFIINGDGEIMKHFISSPPEADLRAEIERAMGES